MRHAFTLIVVTLIIVLVLVFAFSEKKSRPAPVIKGTMEITSTAFTDGTPIPKDYTCDSDDRRPPLTIGKVPPGTRSLALIVSDPDAPMGTWIHYTLWNLPADLPFISEVGLPPGSVEGQTSSGKNGYHGPCPPSGTHRYYFTLYALDTVLNLPVTADANELKHAMDQHILDTATLMGTYKRK